MVEFAYNNIVNSLTLQTPFFANHSLHPKFNIQGVHKVVHLATKDQTMWLVDVRSQFVSKFEKAQ
jgi:gluconate kinase